MFGATYLQKTVNHLPTHILLVGLEKRALQYAEDAFRNAVFGVKVLGCPSSTLLGRPCETITFVACGDVEERAQRVVYTLFVSTSCRHNVVELCAAGQSSGGVTAAQNRSHHPRTVAHSRGCTTRQMPYCVRGPATKIIVPDNAGSGSYRARRKAMAVSNRPQQRSSRSPE